jgi:hypothetical protein
MASTPGLLEKAVKKEEEQQRTRNRIWSSTNSPMVLDHFACSEYASSAEKIVVNGVALSRTLPCSLKRGVFTRMAWWNCSFQRGVE